MADLCEVPNLVAVVAGGMECGGNFVDLLDGVWIHTLGS